MSKSYSTPVSKYQQSSNVHFLQYLYKAEPHEGISHNSASDIQLELLENTELMKCKIRQWAYRIRAKQYIN